MGAEAEPRGDDGILPLILPDVQKLFLAGTACTRRPPDYFAGVVFESLGRGGLLPEAVACRP